VARFRISHIFSSRPISSETGSGRFVGGTDDVQPARHRPQHPPAPAVEVSVAQASGARGVEIVVADRGPGVPADVRARVFQPFLTDKPGHDGLGLARAAQVLRAHPGASIALEHPPAGGLVVTIGLPQHG
jgi:C4-dicarboxylate-specific signal transduction histidine kinase